MEILSLTKKQLANILRRKPVLNFRFYTRAKIILKNYIPYSYFMANKRPEGFEKFWDKKKKTSSKKKQSSSDEEDDENNEKDDKDDKDNKKKNDDRQPSMLGVALFGIILFWMTAKLSKKTTKSNIRKWKKFTKEELFEEIKHGNVKSLEIVETVNEKLVIPRDNNNKIMGISMILEPDQFIEDAKKLKPSIIITIIETNKKSIGNFIFMLVMLVLIFITLPLGIRILRRNLPRSSKMKIKSKPNYNNIFGNSNFMMNPFSLSNSKAVEYGTGKKLNITFKDVAGMEGAKEEIQEFVSFLKKPDKFLRLGAKIPKGALLSGPPGTGKTLLAKACAGEAGVPFFATSGSEFVEMVVGVGAARVRDLFKKAKAKNPCIIFIDEIDAIGKRRSKMGFNDEREGTLNQIFVEMDGFNSDTNVVVFAATNFKESLDPALIRPGRFDRIIEVNLPTMKEREDIFNVHLKKLKLQKELSKEIVAKKMSALTMGMSGADISSVCNEAAILAARLNKDEVGMDEFYEAHDRVLTGLKRKLPLKPYSKKVTAYHESGHTIVGWFLEHAQPVLKVSITPRSKGSLGHTMIMPSEVELYGKEEIEDLICTMYGGRAAEEVFLDSVTTGAQNDIQRATNLAKQYVGLFGMTKEFKNLTMIDYSSGMGERRMFHSSETATKFDKLVKEICEKQYERAKTLLRSKKIEMSKLTDLLSKKDTVELDELKDILGDSPHKSRQEIEIYLNDLKKMKESKNSSKKGVNNEKKETEDNKK